MILQTDVTARRTRVPRPFGELARRQPRVPVFAPQFRVDQLLPVEPVLHVVAANEHSRAVPLAGRIHHPPLGGIETVQRAGTR